MPAMIQIQILNMINSWLFVGATTGLSHLPLEGFVPSVGNSGEGFEGLPQILPVNIISCQFTVSVCNFWPDLFFFFMAFDEEVLANH